MSFENLPLLRFFRAIVDTGSLSAAARDHNISLPAASRKLAQLEAAFGVRLLQRSTRRQSLTAEGQLLYEKSTGILGELESLEQQLMHKASVVTGHLRVMAPVSLGRRTMAPLLARFQELHPDVTVQLFLTDTMMDLIQAGIDVAMRFGAMDDSSYISRPLVPNHRVLCASPAYLLRRGVPAHPDDLARHACLVIGPQIQTDWRLGDMAVRVQGSFVCNDGDVIQQLAMDGHGIAFKSIWDVSQDIEDGRLVHVLPEFSTPSVPLHAIYAHRNHLAPRVRAFIDFMVEQMGQRALPKFLVAPS